MKIIHISDTHIGAPHAAERLSSLIADIRRMTEGAEKWVVVHTGDLIDREAPEYHPTALELIRELQPDDGSARLPFLLVPGNHDYGRSWRIDRDRAAAFREAFAEHIFGDQPAQFPVLHVMDGCAFIGLDSSAAEFGILKGLFAEGELGQDQLDRLNRLLDDPKLAGLYKVVYLHHHPFIDSYAIRPDIGDRHFFSKLYSWYGRGRLRLKDANSLLQILRDRVDLLLFGHKHYGLDHRFEAQRYGLGMALDASSSTAQGMDTDRMRYRVIDVQSGDVSVRTVLIPPASL